MAMACVTFHCNQTDVSTNIDSDISIEFQIEISFVGWVGTSRALYDRFM